MRRNRGLLSAAALAVAVSLGVIPASPVPAPQAAAQAAGVIQVNLKDAVGPEWFDYIGDRTVTAQRIEGIDPNTAEGQQQLTSLDVPQLLRDGAVFPEVARATTTDGTATLTELPAGVYYITVADNPETKDARVSYAPSVVVLAPGTMSRSISPKPQQVGMYAQSYTACNSPTWKDAAAPNTYVEYDFTATAPNPRTDGTIGIYEISFDFSPGHTMQWKDTQAQAAGAPLAFTAVSDTVVVQAQTRWWQWLLPSRTEETVVKLEAPTLVIRGAAQSRELVQGKDYTVVRKDNTTAVFTLTETARAELARLRITDPKAAVEVRVPAHANATGPWGTVARGEVLGTLEAQVTLRTDGMDAERAAVTASTTAHVNVVSRAACFLPTGGEVNPGGGSGGDSATPGKPGTPGASGQAPAAQPGQPDANPHHTGGAAPNSTGEKSHAERAGLASTGAGVIGLTGIALLLILVGIILRRRKNEEDQAS
ncbi:hypothetical protein [Corynebacterium qintianiae]|uniref:hypothetical protein n=1 Tax=Corynebacterium qintianiae TaxID=2709392 RepID=UPI0013EA5A92|nr:hypothetical protein [Corynebacterium qintianiae]